jgi:chromosome segregation ATPase
LGQYSELETEYRNVEAFAEEAEQQRKEMEQKYHLLLEHYKQVVNNTRNQPTLNMDAAGPAFSSKDESDGGRDHRVETQETAHNESSPSLFTEWQQRISDLEQELVAKDG